MQYDALETSTQLPGWVNSSFVFSLMIFANLEGPETVNQRVSKKLVQPFQGKWQQPRTYNKVRNTFCCKTWGLAWKFVFYKASSVNISISSALWTDDVEEFLMNWPKTRLNDVWKFVNSWSILKMSIFGVEL